MSLLLGHYILTHVLCMTLASELELSLTRLASLIKFWLISRYITEKTSLQITDDFQMSYITQITTLQITGDKTDYHDNGLRGHQVWGKEPDRRTSAAHRRISKAVDFPSDAVPDG